MKLYLNGCCVPKKHLGKDKHRPFPAMVETTMHPNAVFNLVLYLLLELAARAAVRHGRIPRNSFLPARS